ncbi:MULTISPECIES: beta-N-acetylhexosaminidase [Dyella]|uniref:beta-N-acetylhexosaminidase n=2 Tax=Dyella TaxID=231454 RepID=A0A4R0YQQ7_9GAMM|nr:MULTISPECIES: family 20 glycosylhydrolase [Dyella]TBR36483.1 beta-hexosaminidase [Dyella terrae]TCI08425.1 beta-hexosaminidase [Dyella soli]
MKPLTAAASLCRLALLWLVTTGVAVAVPAHAPWSLMPQPAKVTQATSGAVQIADGAVVTVRGTKTNEVQAVAEQFVQRVASTRGLHLHLGESGTITFDVDAKADIADDAGYRITVNDKGIVVTSRSARGAFYGSVTLWQLLTQPGWVHGAPAQVSYGSVDDHPRFAWRAVLLDSGRHVQSVADIKQLIDGMALSKLNVLVWHLTEDQGWRLAIPKYPELTKIGACRRAAGLDAELTGSPGTPYCGFYTEDDAREIVRYAAERYVDVVPDIDLPGHSQAAVATYPWLGVTGKRPDVWTDWGVSPWLLKPDAKTLGFVYDVLDEVMRIFPSRYVSIGGDEADKQQWNASPEVRAQMHTLGLANMEQLQGWFTQQVAAHLVKHGRTPVGWDDSIEAGVALPASERVMSWHGNDDERIALTAIRQGHDVVMTPQETLYFDHLQSDLPDEWPGPPLAVTLQMAYGTAVIPPGATAAEAKHVVGVQAGLWAEHMLTFAHVQHALYPRLAALAELGWSPENARNWSSFLQRLPGELARYRALGIGYADSAYAPVFQVTGAADGAFKVTLANQVASGTMRFTTDGAAPTATSAAYVRPLTLANHTTLRAATFAADGFELAAPRTQVLDASTLTTRDSTALATCSKQPPTHLEGVRPASGDRPRYAVDIGNACWLWPQAPLHGIKHVSITAERLAWRFGDEAKDATVYRKTGAAGEFEIHADTCKGPLLARMPLDSTVQGQVHLKADVAMPAGAGARDVCVFATGDPRDGQWALARMTFSQ